MNIQQEIAELEARLAELKKRVEDSRRSMWFQPTGGKKYNHPCFSRECGFEADTIIQASRIEGYPVFRTKEDCDNWCRAMNVMLKYRMMGVPIVDGRVQYGFSVSSGNGSRIFLGQKVSIYHGVVFNEISELRLAIQAVGGTCNLKSALFTLAGVKGYKVNPV